MAGGAVALVVTGVAAGAPLSEGAPAAPRAPARSVRRLPVDAYAAIWAGRAPEGFEQCDFSWTREAASAERRNATAKQSRSISAAGLHETPQVSFAGAISKAPGGEHGRVTLGVKRGTVTFEADNAERWAKLETRGRAAAVAALPPLERDRTGGLDEALQVVLPQSALVGEIVIASDSSYPNLEARFYALAEDEDTVLAAFDDAGAEAVRATCADEEVLGYSWDRTVVPGFARRRATIVVRAECTGSYEGVLDVWVKRVLDATIVVACRWGDCEPIARSIRVHPKA